MMLQPAAVTRYGVILCSRRCRTRCTFRFSPSSAIHSLYRSSIHTKRRIHGSIATDRAVVPQTFVHDYFSANNSIDRGWVKNGVMAVLRSVAEPPREKNASVVPDEPDLECKMEEQGLSSEIEDELPRFASISPPTSDTTSFPTRPGKKLDGIRTGGHPDIPLDASSQLTAAAARLPSSASVRRSIATYLSLSKPRLSFLVVLTSTAAYSLYPIPEILTTTASLASTSTTFSASALTLTYLTTGTFLSSASANTLNMLAEPKHDALMTRTRNRPLVRKLVTPAATSMFALSTGTAGLTLLYLGTNPTVAALSAINIFLYAGIYTPLKRISVVNTWVGAIVGAIPPLMGWAAAAGQSATAEHHSWPDLLFNPETSPGGWLLAALLFAWQFPHFNALSHSIRDEYRHAGYRMMAWTNPARNARVALRYSLLLFPISAGLYVVGVVDSGFLLVSSASNLWVSVQAYRFWRTSGARGTARGLFWASIWSLPLLMVGGLLCKKGVWDGVFDRDFLTAHSSSSSSSDIGPDEISHTNEHEDDGDGDGDDELQR